MAKTKEDLIQSIVESLARIQRAHQTDMPHELEVSRAQAGMLFMLFHHKETHVKQLSEFLGISKSATSQLLDPLLDRRLVHRRPDPKDRRILRLRLTAEGQNVVKKLNKLKYAGLRSALTRLNEADLSELARIYKKLDADLDAGLK